MARFRAFFKLGELEKLLEAHPRLSKMEKILVEKHGFTEGNARRYMARVLRTIIDDFGESYFADMSKHLDRIGELRSKLSDIYEAIREGKGVPEHVETGSVNDLFTELDKEMKALQSPKGAASKAGKAHYSNDTLARAAEEAKDTATQRIVRDVARRAPDEVGKAIRAETQGGLTRALKELTDRLRKEGKKEDEIARLQNGIEEMNKAYHRADIATALTDQPLEISVAVERLSDPALRRVVGRNRRLAQLAHENPEKLLELWENYRQKNASYPFSKYVFYDSRLVRGLIGEFGAAFKLGDDFFLLKAPDYDVTIPGTDLVAVARSTGEVFLIDNKAWKAEEVDSVNALTRNLPQNIADDVKSFRKTFKGRTDTPQGLIASVKRLGDASREIKKLVAGKAKEEIATKAIQQQIKNILDKNDVRRVVTNAGGNVNGLSEALEKLGIELKDLNE